MRSEPRGNFLIDRMSHRHNLTVPGIVGYRPQSSKGVKSENLTDPYNLDHYSGVGGVNADGGPSGAFDPSVIPGDHH